MRKKLAQLPEHQARMLHDVAVGKTAELVPAGAGFAFATAVLLPGVA